MHELAIVEDLITMSEKQLEINGGTEIEKIVVKVGRLSGVEPHLLKSSFEFYKVQTKAKNAKLELKLQNVVVECKSCGEKSELDKNEFVCPKCGSAELNVTDGEDLYLMQIEMK